MAGQSINDRLTAARYSIAGQGLAKSVCKATTEEVIGPKKKHLDCKFHICRKSAIFCIASYIITICVFASGLISCISSHLSMITCNMQGLDESVYRL